MSSKRNILVWKETQGGKEHRGRAWFHLFRFHHHRIRYHHSPGKEKKHRVVKGTQSTKRNRYVWKETQNVAFLRSYYVLYLHVFFDIACFFFLMTMSSSFRSDPDDAPLRPGPIWSRHVSFDPWMLLSPFTFISFDPWMFLFHLHSHPLSSLTLGGPI